MVLAVVADRAGVRIRAAQGYVNLGTFDARRRPVMEEEMLQRGDAVPHFEVRTLDSEVFRYPAIWQHKNLVLVTVPATVADDSYIAALAALGSEFHGRDSVCVVTQDAVTGLPVPGVLVADRWGEIIHVATASDVEELPAPRELLDWLDYVAQRCPECEGEAK